MPLSVRYQRRDAKSNAVGGGIVLDAGLRQAIAAWRTLPQPLRRAVLSIVDAKP
jgi:hypothetical protein